MYRKPIIIAVIFYAAFMSMDISAFEAGPVDIHGFVSQGFLKSDANNFLAKTEDGSFQFNEVGINFSTTVTDKLHLGMQLFARDIGAVGNNKLNLDWAFGDFRWFDWLGFRAGKIKIPLGLQNEIRDIDMLRTCILLPQGVYFDIFRDNLISIQGVGIYGTIPINPMGRLLYQFQYGSFDVDKDSGASKVFAEGFDLDGFEVDDVTIASLKWDTPLEGLQVAASYYETTAEMNVRTQFPMGPLPAGVPLTVDFSKFSWNIYSFEYNWKNLTISAEYSLILMETRTLFDSQVVVPEEENTDEGYYVSASYRFTDWFELGAYYSIYYPNKNDKDGTEYESMGEPNHRAWSKDFALSTRFDLNENWIIKLEGHAMNGTAILVQSNNLDGMDKNWFLFAAKVTFYF